MGTEIETINYYEIERKINGPYKYHQRLEMLIEIRAQKWAEATKVTTRLTFEPKSFGGSSDKLGASACKLQEVDDEIAVVIKNLTRELAKVRAIIAVMPEGRLRTLLIDRYTKYMNWPDVADDINVKPRNIWEIRKKALLKVEEILKTVDIVVSI